MSEEPETQERPSFDKPPFVRKYLVEDETNPNKNRTVLNISLNDEEIAIIHKLKPVLDLDGDGSTIKFLMNLGVIVVESEEGRLWTQHLHSRLASLKSRIRKKKVKL